MHEQQDLKSQFLARCTDIKNAGRKRSVANRNAKQLPTQFELNRLLSYDRESGLLQWKKRPAFRKKPGLAAFTWKNTAGYLYDRIEGEQYLAHRVIWKMVNGEEPDVVDHLNRIRTDNRIANLRSTTNSENCRNKRKLLRNGKSTSEFPGVYWNARQSCWIAVVRIDGKLVTLGRFREETDAWETAEPYFPYFKRAPSV